jgi:hypothetical protein
LVAAEGSVGGFGEGGALAGGGEVRVDEFFGLGVLAVEEEAADLG